VRSLPSSEAASASASGGPHARRSLRRPFRRLAGVLRNYFSAALRNLFRNRAYAAINIAALTIPYQSEPDVILRYPTLCGPASVGYRGSKKSRPFVNAVAPHCRLELTNDKFRTCNVWVAEVQYVAVRVKSNHEPASPTNKLPAHRLSPYRRRVSEQHQLVR
jgi:hypothetical protein